jgi:hypothetical protein
VTVVIRGRKAGGESLRFTGIPVVFVSETFNVEMNEGDYQ